MPLNRKKRSPTRATKNTDKNKKHQQEQKGPLTREINTS